MGLPDVDAAQDHASVPIPRRSKLATSHILEILDGNLRLECKRLLRTGTPTWVGSAVPMVTARRKASRVNSEGRRQGPQSARSISDH